MMPPRLGPSHQPFREKQNNGQREEAATLRDSGGCLNHWFPRRRYELSVRDHRWSDWNTMPVKLTAEKTTVSVRNSSLRVPDSFLPPLDRARPTRDLKTR